jgi:hypothetical protein
MFRRLMIVILLASQALLVGWIGWHACPNKTELGHMAAAIYFWHTLRFDVFSVNPPLTRIVTGLPVVLCDPKYDWDSYSSRPQDRSEWAMGTAFVAANNPETIRRCFVLARWSLIPLVLLGGYCGYRLSRGVYGEWAGCVFLALWCFSPLVLAWGATICPDAVAAALGLVAVYTFRQWLYKPDWPRAAVAGVCLGLLPLTKLTWIIALGIWPVVWCLWTIPLCLRNASKRCLSLPPIGQLAAILILALYTLNTGYLFDGTCRPLGRYVFISHSLSGHEVTENQQAAESGNRFAGTWPGAIPVPLPTDFVQGIDTQRYDFERGLPSYLSGQWADHGWWYYYLYAVAIKEPLGAWCLVALAIGVTIFDWRRKKPSPSASLPQTGEGSQSPGPPPPNAEHPQGTGEICSASWRDEMLVLAPGLAILVLVSSQTGFSAHSRYIIPALPFFFVWASKVGRAFERCVIPRRVSQRAGGARGWLLRRRRPAMAVMVLAALAWSVGSSLTIYPHSLSYFNELAVVLPTPTDATYPNPVSGSGACRGILETVKYGLSAGPRNGPRHLLDSNIDWGQDLFYLEDWCQSHPEAQPMQVAYFGGYPLERSKVKSAGDPPFGPDDLQPGDKNDSVAFGPLPGWYALSVNELYSRSQHYRYFLNFRPVATAGYSIYIYHITLDEANRVRSALELPELAKGWRPAEGN